MGFAVGLTVGLVGIMMIIFMPIQYGYAITLFSTIFTRMGFISFNGNSIVVYQILSLVFLVKLIIISKKVYVIIPLSLFSFVLYAAASIFLALLYTDVYVINPDGFYAPIRFSVQQFTQYLYLAFGIVFMAFTSHMLYTGKISQEYILDIFDAAYLVTIALGISQLFIDTDVFNNIFKNSEIGIYSQRISLMHNNLYRIDSVFGEPSMFSLFLVPILCIHLYRILTGRCKWKDIIFVGSGLLICLENRSSSAVLGIAIMAACIVLLALGNIALGRIKVKRRFFFYFGVLLMVACIGVFLMRRHLLDMIDLFIEKLMGENVSGIDRMYSARIQWKVFKDHFLFGVGFGTIRSADLITGWLAEMGVVGFGFYVYYFISICTRLWKSNTYFATELMIAIIIHNGIMMASVPEYSIINVWVYYALAECVTTHRQSEISYSRSLRF